VARLRHDSRDVPPPAPDAYAEPRARMVREQLVARGIRDERVLEVMGRVPRHELVPEAQRDDAYEDGPLPIGEGQTISQPYIVAAMSEGRALSGDERVLEIGTGSGYQAAVLSALAREVYTIELEPVARRRAPGDLERLGCTNVQHAHGRRLSRLARGRAVRRDPRHRALPTTCRRRCSSSSPSAAGS
jgi:protein-L-isoaspartate(D-aspartate) O-methyltransferase